LYEEAVEALHADLEAMEKENEHLNELLNSNEKGMKAMHGSTSSMLGIPANQFGLTDGASTMNTRSDVVLQDRIHKLKMLVRFLKRENTNLKNAELRRLVLDLSDPGDAMNRIVQQEIKDDLETVVGERRSHTELHDWLASPLVVDLCYSKSKLTSHWVSKAFDPRNQLMATVAKFENILQ
jgi:hypothetical protein